MWAFLNVHLYLVLAVSFKYGKQIPVLLQSGLYIGRTSVSNPLASVEEEKEADSQNETPVFADPKEE